MAIGGSLFLIVAGLIVAVSPGGQAGRPDTRYAGLVMTAVGLLILFFAIALRHRSAWRLDRRRAQYARLRTARRLARRPGRRPSSISAAAPYIAPAPERPLSTLGQVDTLVNHTQMPGQHGKLPPSPRGRYRYPV
jgi:hypothetical protein